MFENTFYNVWFSERDIRLIVRIFDFKEYIFSFEDQSLKDFRFKSFLSRKYQISKISYKTCSPSHSLINILCDQRPWVLQHLDLELVPNVNLLMVEGPVQVVHIAG